MDGSPDEKTPPHTRSVAISRQPAPKGTSGRSFWRLRLRSGFALPAPHAPETFLILIDGRSHLDCRAAADVGQRTEVDAAPGPDGLDAEGHRQMALAGAGLADEVDDLVPIDEVEAGQGHDAGAVERGLEREVEAGQGLDRG